MTPRHARPSRRRWVAAVAVVTVALTWSLVRAGGPEREAAAPVPSPSPVADPSDPVAQALSVLHRWDAARAEAWSSGSVPALRRLYVDGAGASDVRLLRDYTDRGLRVEDLRMQVLALDVLRRGPGEWHLRVTDRVARAVLVGPAGRSLLPRDEATTRTVRLVRHAGRWCAAAVRPG